MSTDPQLDAIAHMEKAIACLALELPGEVWDDVNAIWQRARRELELERNRTTETVTFLQEAQEGDTAALMNAYDENRRLRELANEMLSTFTEQGSIGSINNSLRTPWQSTKRIDRWRAALAQEGNDH